VATNYALSTDSNVTTLTGSQGCMIEYLRFSGTQGGILVWSPASGITIQENACDSNNPPAGGASSKANIYLNGYSTGFTPDSGVENISILWNTFFNNCAAIRAVAFPDSGGGCAATWVNGYNNGLTWSNNTINLTEEGLKLSQQSGPGIMSLNADVENNNMQGNSRILIETQQETNGTATYSHNAFYQPYNPGFNTFELSMPQYTSSLSPTHTANDNVFIGNVPVTLTGSGGHYGIGMELWGAGTIAEYNLLQGGNGPDTCAAGWGCTGWQICIGEPFTNATVTNNYFSGTDVWNGTANEVSNAVTYEDGASSSNTGLVVSSNTVLQTSAPIPVTAPEISQVPGSGGTTLSMSNGDTNHGLSIFYTIDGSTPAIFPPGGSAGTSQVYTAPFVATPGTTVRALASWGQGANQGIVFPSFGYVPSNVVSVVVAATRRTVVGAYLSAPNNANTMRAGGTLQFTAHAIYSDGSTGTLPDAQGNAVTSWNTTNHRVAKVSSRGHVTAIAVGTVNVQAMVGSVPVSPWTVTVGAAASSAAQATSAPQAISAAQPTSAAQVDTAPQADAAAQAASSADAVAGDSGGSAALDQAPPAAGPETAPVGPASGPTPGADTEPAPIAPASGPMPAAAGAPLTDKFLGPFWRLVAPAGGTASISNSHLFIAVPGGSSHDTLVPANQAVRVVQSIGNEDFDVAIKIDFPMVATEGDTSQGLMVLSDDEDFITFALVTDGSAIGLSARTVTHGVGNDVLNDMSFSQYQNPMYLRLTKSKSNYVAFYSIDGVGWNEAANFSYAPASTAVGPFASNYGDASAFPVLMSVSWFGVREQ
jgi:Chitobiase/beta-hexosaminidase C-terminal domain/Bacterial Ig-like domain (group 2)